MRKAFLSLAIAVLPLAALAANVKYHDVSATFVSADAKAHTFTVTLDDGSTATGKAEGKAIKELAALKAGDHISMTCKDNEKGEHLAATAIKVLK